MPYDPSSDPTARNRPLQVPTEIPEQKAEVLPGDPAVSRVYEAVMGMQLTISALTARVCDLEGRMTATSMALLEVEQTALSYYKRGRNIRASAQRMDPTLADDDDG